MRASTLVVPGNTHTRLERHLFPGDGKEAAAILLCARVYVEGLKLLVRNVVLIPHAQCARQSDYLTWPGEYIDTALDLANTDNLSIILLHSHPNGLYEFSALDDESDREVMPCLFLASPRERANTTISHGSAIMVPGGAMRARLYDPAIRPKDLDLVAVYGDCINFYWGNDEVPQDRPMAFSESMNCELRKLSVAIIGFSGTGSIVGEQLLRMGVGEIIAIDDDRIENKNLNRILNSTQESAHKKLLKVDVFKEAAAGIRPSTRVVAVPHALGTIEGVHAAAMADIVFCCVDSEEGRHLSDRLAAAMLQPLFDVGVTIPVRMPSRGMTIANVCGRVDYVQPGGTTLLDRGVYTPQSLAAEALQKANPDAYAKRVKEGYMPGSGLEAPSVICVNMQAASIVVQEMVARAYPYRLDGNVGFARVEFDLAVGEQSRNGESAFGKKELDWLARGLQSPLLGLPSLEDAR